MRFRRATRHTGRGPGGHSQRTRRGGPERGFAGRAGRPVGGGFRSGAAHPIGQSDRSGAGAPARNEGRYHPVPGAHCWALRRIRRSGRRMGQQWRSRGRLRPRRQPRLDQPTCGARGWIDLGDRPLRSLRLFRWRGPAGAWRCPRSHVRISGVRDVRVGGIDDPRRSGGSDGASDRARRSDGVLQRATPGQIHRRRACRRSLRRWPDARAREER